MNAKGKKFVPVMITPFDQTITLDWDGLSPLVEFYLAAGVKGLFANCLSSEMFSITDEEKIELVTRIVRKVDGAVPVVATGSFGNRLEDKAEFIKRMHATGVDAVILVTGLIAGAEADEEQFLQQFEQILRLTGSISLGLYECPAPYKRVISPMLFKKLLSSGRLIYHKDTSLIREKVKAKLDMLKENRNSSLEFYDAHTPNAAYSLQMGASGLSTISGNFYPEILVWMCRHATDPEKQETVNWLQSELTRVDPLIHEAYPLSAKYFLKKRGLPIEPVSRTYIFELTTEQKKRLDGLYTDFTGWCERLKIEQVR
jgi:4-hydroxy-tetrahydrodipicolinate synthase